MNAVCLKIGSVIMLMVIFGASGRSIRGILEKINFPSFNQRRQIREHQQQVMEMPKYWYQIKLNKRDGAVFDDIHRRGDIRDDIIQHDSNRVGTMRNEVNRPGVIRDDANRASVITDAVNRAGSSRDDVIDAVNRAGSSRDDVMDAVNRATSNRDIVKSQQFGSETSAKESDATKVGCPVLTDGHQLFMCPTADEFGQYNCIDDHNLCDAIRNCINGEDEDQTVCMFHRMTLSYFKLLMTAIYGLTRSII